LYFFYLPLVNCSLQTLVYSANLAYRSRFDLSPPGRRTWPRNAKIDLAQRWWHTPSFDSPHGILPVTGLTARNCSLVWFSHGIQHSPFPRLPSRQECINSLLPIRNAVSRSISDTVPSLSQNLKKQTNW